MVVNHQNIANIGNVQNIAMVNDKNIAIIWQTLVLLAVCIYVSLFEETEFTWLLTNSQTIFHNININTSAV